MLKLLPKDIVLKHQVVPVSRTGSTLTVAMADPSNIYAIDELKFLTQYNIHPVVASEAAVEAAILRYYDKGPNLDEMIGEFDEEVDFTAGDEESVRDQPLTPRPARASSRPCPRAPRPRARDRAQRGSGHRPRGPGPCLARRACPRVLWPATAPCLAA